jgi:uncharacterized membrane protein SpoIIM required for sporulation
VSTIATRRARWEELAKLLDTAERGGAERMPAADLKRLCSLYRQVTIDLSRARTEGQDPDLVRYLNTLASRAHGQVYAARPVRVWGVLPFVLTGFPRLVRRRARPVLVAAAVFLLSTVASFLAVVRDPELAYSLFDEKIVENENAGLEHLEGEYKGNFTFTWKESPFLAVVIVANNVRVAAIAFAVGALLCLPCLFLLVFTGRMVGVLAGLLWLKGHFLDFCALILTHGVLELTAICIAAGGGLLLGWAVIAPGRLTRRDALKQAAGDAFGLLGGAMLLLVAAGLIEAHVTPHFPQPVRWGVAAASAAFLVWYLGFVGRQAHSPQASR